MEQYFLLAGRQKAKNSVYVFVQTVDEAKIVKRVAKVKLIPAVKKNNQRH